MKKRSRLSIRLFFVGITPAPSAGSHHEGWKRCPGEGIQDTPQGVPEADDVALCQIAGEQRPDWLAHKAVSTLRNKPPGLRLVQHDEVTGNHQYFLKELMKDLDRIEAKVERLEAEIVRRTQPCERELSLLNTIPGVEWITTRTINGLGGCAQAAGSDTTATG